MTTRELTPDSFVSADMQICSWGAHAGINMVKCEGAAQLLGEQKEYLSLCWISSARAPSRTRIQRPRLKPHPDMR